MKRAFLILAGSFLSLCFWNSASSQNTNLDYKSAIKIYNLTFYDGYSKTISLGDSSLSYYYTTSSTLQIFHPVIAFQWKNKRNNFHEVELTNFSLAQNSTGTIIQNDSLLSPGPFISGSDIVTSNISLRYEYIQNFFRTRENRIVPSLGFSCSPYFRQTFISPYISTLFPTSEKMIGLRAYVIPRVTFYLNSKFFIDVNIPLCLVDWYYLSYKEMDPSLPVNRWTSKSVNYEGVPKIYGGRIGVGIKI